LRNDIIKSVKIKEKETMKKELTTQELIKFSKEILEVKNRRERSFKLGRF